MHARYADPGGPSCITRLWFVLKSRKLFMLDTSNKSECSVCGLAATSGLKACSHVGGM